MFWRYLSGDDASVLNKRVYGGMGRDGWIDKHPYDSNKYIAVYFVPNQGEMNQGYKYRSFDSLQDAKQGLSEAFWPGLFGQRKPSNQLSDKGNDWKERLYDYLTLYSGR